jgi:hypothetical protein
LSAAVGMALKLALPGRFDRLAIILCLLLGWSGVIAYDSLASAIPSSSRDRGHSLLAWRALSCLTAPALSQRDLAWFCVARGKLPLFGSSRLLALGISGLFRVLTPGTDWIATVPAGDDSCRRSSRRSSRLRRGRCRERSCVSCRLREAAPEGSQWGGSTCFSVQRALRVGEDYPSHNREHFPIH